MKQTTKLLEYKFDKCDATSCIVSDLMPCYHHYSIGRNEHKIIIMSIHQPRYSIYKQIDQITLLSKGEIIYHGSRSEATNYFKHMGKN